MAFNQIISLFLFVALCSCAPSQDFLGNSDEVTSLPGLHFKLNFHHYSGYLDSYNASKMHYWFFESQNDPANDPVVLWLNGGPGCSSLLGALVENGPIELNTDGTLKQNPYAWNQRANVIFLETPAGVGFSYNAQKDYKTGDNATAKLNFQAMNSFIQKFPQYATNEFYIAGESYGGVYIPTLAALVQQNKFAKFRGIAIGNGYLEQTMLANSLLHFAYSHGLYGKVVYDDMINKCCSGVTPIEKCDIVNSQDASCLQAVATVQTKLMQAPLNWYDIYDDCDNSGIRDGSGKSLNPDQVAKRLVTKHLLKHVPEEARQVGDNPSCVNLDFVANYLNRKDVRTALHIDAQSEDWAPCSAEVNNNYVNEYTSLTTVVQGLLDNGLKVLIYNGDVDTVCNFLGDQWFTEGLGRKPAQDYAPWMYNKPGVGQQVAGFYKIYDNLGYTTVRGSGHTVPQYKPQVAYEMFQKFLNMTGEGKEFHKMFN